MYLAQSTNIIGTHSRSNWNLEMLVFEERGKLRSNQRKTSQSKDKNQQQAQPT